MLGSGGMGAVFAAFDTRLKRRVALKILHVTGSDRGHAPILKEARAAAALDHPNAVQVFDVDRWGHTTLPTTTVAATRQASVELGCPKPDH